MIKKLIDRATIYFRTDVGYLARSGSWLAAGQVISALATFGLAVGFANLLPKETYGTYKFVLSIAGILAVFTLPGMVTAVTRAVAQGNEGAVLPSLKTRLRWGVIGGALSLLLAGYYFFNSNLELTLSFLICAAFLPIFDAFSIYEGLLHGKKEFNISARYGIWQKLLSVALMATAMLVTQNLFVLLLAYFIPYTLLRYFFFRRTIRQITTVSSEPAEDTLLYGRHLSLMSALGGLAQYIDRVLLFHFLGAVPVALYSIAVAPPEQIKGLLKQIQILALPKFSARTHEEIRGGILRKTLQFGALLIVATVAYILLAPVVFRVFFPEYTDAIRFSQVFSLSIFAIVLFIPLSAMQALKETKKLYIFNLSTAIVQILLYPPLIILYGLWGAIGAWMAGRAFNTALAFYLFYRKSKTIREHS